MRSFIPLSFFAIGAMAQGIAINSPAPGSTVKSGAKITVQVIRYSSIMYATEVGLAIGIAGCNMGSCPSPVSALGTVLYHGPFDPQYHGPGQQYENFTVQVPSFLSHEPAAINVVRFFLTGAGPSPATGDAQSVIHIA